MVVLGNYFFNLDFQNYQHEIEQNYPRSWGMSNWLESGIFGDNKNVNVSKLVEICT